MITQDISFRLPVDVVEALRHYALERREAPDQLVAEALRIALSPLRQQALQSLNAEVSRQRAKSKQSRHGSLAHLDEAEERRLAFLLSENRQRPLTSDEQVELQHLYDRIEEVATKRAAAIAIATGAPLANRAK